MDSAEQGSGTFAQYYLDPLNMKLDAEMHPSITYLLGWREHRYRYYYYYPEFTPDFSLLDEDKKHSDDVKRAEEKKAEAKDKDSEVEEEKAEADEEADEE